MVGLTPLMERTRGRPEVTIGLIDGPVALDHPGLARDQVRELPGRGAGSRPNSNAGLHGVFVAGILSAERGAAAPAICPGCTLLVRPIFGDTASIDDMPSTTPAELAQAILDCVDAGARVLNISAALAPPFLKNEQAVGKGPDLCRKARRDCGGGSRQPSHARRDDHHPPSMGGAGRLLQPAGPALGAFESGTFDRPSRIGRAGRGHHQSGVRTTRPVTSGGTSAAAPFVTGAMALLWSEFPSATAAEVKGAVLHAHRRRTTVVPPLLDAWGAYQTLRR